MLKNEKDLDIDKITLYELALNIIPTVGDDGAIKTFEKVKGIIEKVKIENITVSEPALLPLKYTMSKTVDSKKQKYNQAYFGWIKFDADPSELESLKEKLDHNNELLRYMIVKSEKETTISAQEVSETLSGKKEEKKVAEDVKEEIPVVEEEIDEGEIDVEISSQAEVDKAIDDLVGEEPKGITF